jgi:gluconate 2-dehydrogenase gamma chain
LFRTALRGVREDLERNGGTPFEKLPGPQQDAYLTVLQTQQKDLAGVPSRVFFESLLSMTVEGYFSDPVYGGNKDMAAWAMIGFPGAYGAYYDQVDRYGVRFDHPPRSLAQSGQGHLMVNPDIPARVPARAGRKGP